jgi:DHA1 family multidrug resistance protein-like MFS transporter
LGTSLPMGAMIGPVIGGLIAASFGHRQVFVFVGCAAFLAAMLVAFVAHEDPSTRQQAPEKSSPLAALAGVGRDLVATLRHPGLGGPIALLFVLQFGLGSTNPVMELHVRDLVDHQTFGESLLGRVASWLPRPATEHLDAAGAVAASLTLATSLLFAGMAFANLLALPWWGRLGDRFGHARALRWCGIGGVISLCIQANAEGYSTLFVGRFLMGLTMAGAGPLVFGLAAKLIPQARRGSAMGAVFSARTLAVSAGAACVGPMVNRTGIPGMMFLAAGFVGLALLVFAFQKSPRAGRTGESAP